MKQNTYLQIAAFLMLLLILSCNSKTQSTEETGRAAFVPERNPVEVLMLEPSTFTRQLVSNGKLEALQKSSLRFRTGGIVQHVAVANGQRVSAGSLIATLDDFEAQQNLLKAENSLQTAKLEYHDVLIGLGYELADSLSIPAEKRELAKVRSGYATAISNFTMAQQNLQHCRLSAPFSGVVANLSAKEHEETGSSVFCTLIDDSQFRVNFKVLETELPGVKKGMNVIVVPFSDDELTVYGTIKEINPVVDDNGLVAVAALIKNPGHLLEGMNVKVLIEEEIPGQYVVPKSAVVLRDNWEVLFKVVNGKAYWNYIQTVYENSNSYSVIPHPEKSTASLNPGDTIIVSGNLNLAHESEVEVKSPL
ncbi:MAG: efflux RND transporter periplasmic adaptor subunit [Prolixibacteraceae bacterium]|jgi:membrane fusion protein (multidrug efflux system)|nr:efflux RND transporter periplasmic adaptor subunit [Prolixibacteraceae bacterium]